MVTGKTRLTTEPERVNPVVPIHLWRSPQGADSEVLVITHLDVYSVMYDHAGAALPNETGGFLLGRVGWDVRAHAWLVEVDEAVPVEPIAQNPVHFSFGWRDVDRVRSRREERGKALVGWYHTHPDMGIFLSETDLEKTHRVLFSEPFQVALVYDPVRGRAGYFFWEDGRRIDASAAVWREFELVVADDDSPAADRTAQLAPPVEIVVPPGPGTDVSTIAKVFAPRIMSDSAAFLNTKFREAAQAAVASVPVTAAETGAAPEPVETTPRPALNAQPASPVMSGDSTTGTQRLAADTGSIQEMAGSAAERSDQGPNLAGLGARRPSSFFVGVLVGIGGGLLVLLGYLLLGR